MPQFYYRGRDKEGKLRVGQRNAVSADNLNSDLVKEGIFPIQIAANETKHSLIEKLQNALQGKTAHLQELSIFSRQMQLLHQAGVPLVSAFRQLAANSRSKKLSVALIGLIEYVEKGESLGTAMQHFPDTFTPLMISIVQVGENTGHLSDAFKHLHNYLEFELGSTRKLKEAFRYPMFVFISIAIAIVTLNVFVIPSFSKFYSNLSVSLPWQTQVLIASSNFFINYGVLLLIGLVGFIIYAYYYLHTKPGRLWWDRLTYKIPFVGNVIRRINVIRFCQILSVTLSSGLSVTQSLTLVRNVIANQYLVSQIQQMQEAIERGLSFTNAISKAEIFNPLELQIVMVGEKNGELSPSLNSIADFHTHEIEFDLKKMNDVIGPFMVGSIGGLVLIIALGVYLPIWNMIDLMHP